MLDNLVVLDDVTGLADKSHSFVEFLTYCRKYDNNVLYIFHEPALSSSKFMDIMSRTQIFSHRHGPCTQLLAKFVARGKGYITKQQLWIANVVRTIENQTGFTCFCLDKRPGVSGAARYRSMVENPEIQYCYLNLNNSDKLFNTFVSKGTDDKDSINFVIAKHLGEIASGQVYELKTNQNEPSSTHEKEHQLRNQQGRGVSSTRNARIQFKSTHTTPGFLLAHRNHAVKRDAACHEGT